MNTAISLAINLHSCSGDILPLKEFYGFYLFFLAVTFQTFARGETVRYYAVKGFMNKEKRKKFDSVEKIVKEKKNKI